MDPVCTMLDFLDPSKLLSHWAGCEEPPGSDVVYLGLNDPVTDGEAKGLPEGATVCDGSEKQGTIKSADGKKDLDLRKEGDVNTFLKESGVDKLREKPDGTMETEAERDKRMEQLEAVFLGEKKDGKRVGTGMDPNSRDEMAEFIQTLQKVENGEMDMKRLVISGHHYPDEMGIHGTGPKDSGMRFSQLQTVLDNFKGAQGGVEHLMLSACNTENGYKAQDDLYQHLLPNLETVWGYNGYAPSLGPDVRNNSAAHIAAWDAATRSEDPHAVRDEAKTRVNAAVHEY